LKLSPRTYMARPINTFPLAIRISYDGSAVGHDDRRVLADKTGELRVKLRKHYVIVVQDMNPVAPSSRYAEVDVFLSAHVPRLAIIGYLSAAELPHHTLDVDVGRAVIDDLDLHILGRSYSCKYALKCGPKIFSPIVRRDHDRPERPWTPTGNRLNAGVSHDPGGLAAQWKYASEH